MEKNCLYYQYRCDDNINDVLINIDMTLYYSNEKKHEPR